MKKNKIKSGLASILKIAANAVQGVEQDVPDYIKNERMSECYRCPFLNESLMQCKSCGCFVKVKTEFRQEECPEGKWSKWTPDMDNKDQDKE